MQYLLTESEYTRLVSWADAAQRLPEAELQAFCTLVSDKMPIKWTWGDGATTPKPWGCILTRKNEWYCDQCPAQKLCPYEHKNWSK